MDAPRFETGAEPEFFVTQIARHERMHDGMVRVYLACERGDAIRIEYTVVCSLAALADMGRQCLTIAAECAASPLAEIASMVSH